MIRALLLILSLFALVGCEPGRCLRHSDCPTGASCKRGVCRLPPNQSTSLAQPGEQENQSVEPSQSVEQTEEHAESEVDASVASTSSSSNASAAATSDESLSDPTSSSTEASSSLLSGDGSTPDDGNVDAGWDAANPRDAAFDAAYSTRD